MTLDCFLNRTKLHRTGDISLKKQNMDKCHKVMLKHGYFHYLAHPVLDYDNKNPTRLVVRRGEGRIIFLLPNTMNTRGKSAMQSPGDGLLD